MINFPLEENLAKKTSRDLLSIKVFMLVLSFASKIFPKHQRSLSVEMYDCGLQIPEPYFQVIFHLLIPKKSFIVIFLFKYKFSGCFLYSNSKKYSIVNSLFKSKAK